MVCHPVCTPSGLAVSPGCSAVLAAVRARRPRGLDAAGSRSAEQFSGFKVGSDNNLVAGKKSRIHKSSPPPDADRARVRELQDDRRDAFWHESAHGDVKNPTARAFRAQLYVQAGVPTTRERDDIFRQGKLVCSSPAVFMRTRSRHSVALDCCTGSRPTHRPRQNISKRDLRARAERESGRPDAVNDWFTATSHHRLPQPLPYLYPLAGTIGTATCTVTQKESQYIAHLACAMVPAYGSIKTDESGRAAQFVMPAPIRSTERAP